MHLSEVLTALQGMTPAARAQLEKVAIEETAHLRWLPSIGPQLDAYNSQADILLFGGQPGGGKTEILLGLAFNCHENALLMRRQYTDLDAMIEAALRINGSRTGFNGSPPPSLRHDKGRIDFGAAARIGDEQHWMGRPHDFLGIDEATQFSAKQIRFLRGWLRSVKPGQRVRTVLATNPPLTADGLWVHEMFGPWLNPQHAKPARAGELRWFIVDEADSDIEVEGPGIYPIDGRDYEAESRTFIPSALSDNPFLASTDYQKRLDALPAEVRNILLGGFATSFRDADFQVMPTSWLREAQSRWKLTPPDGIPMCAIGVDVAAGGADNTVLSIRHDGWFAPLIVIPGSKTPLGRDVAGLVVSHRRDAAVVILDMGGGYGGSPFEHLRDNLGHEAVARYNGAEASTARTSDKQLPFYNRRAEAYWKFREALDPGQLQGSPIMLPDDPNLIAELTAPTFEVTPRGIKIESKEDIKARLGHSPDRADAVVMSWWRGSKMATHFHEWRADQRSEIRPDQGFGRGRGAVVNLGPRRGSRG